jgi:hypothetical protein
MKIQMNNHFGNEHIMIIIIKQILVKKHIVFSLS